MTTTRWTLTLALLTALGVLPVPNKAVASNSKDRSAIASPKPLELEGAALAAAVKQTPAEIRSGRLGH
jgi:hypothetical protein